MIIRSSEKGQALIIIALAAAVLFAFSALAIANISRPVAFITSAQKVLLIIEPAHIQLLS